MLSSAIQQSGPVRPAFTMKPSSSSLTKTAIRPFPRSTSMPTRSPWTMGRKPSHFVTLPRNVREPLRVESPQHSSPLGRTVPGGSARFGAYLSCATPSVRLPLAFASVNSAKCVPLCRRSRVLLQAAMRYRFPAPPPGGPGRLALLTFFSSVGGLSGSAATEPPVGPALVGLGADSPRTTHAPSSSKRISP